MSKVDDIVKQDVYAAKVGVIGRGFIGNACLELFKDRFETLSYDKHLECPNTLSDVVAQSHFVFMAVPTPMKKSGECHTGIVESVLADIQAEAAKTGRDPNEFVIVVKSTVPPGFTKRMKKRHPSFRIVFSPEFLTEANAVDDFKTANRIVLGGDHEDCFLLFKLFEGVWPERACHPDVCTHKDGPVKIVHCDSSTAEMVKLFTNAILTVRVMFANEMYFLCKRLGIDYDDVRNVACLDRRINPSHLLVPGPDGNVGYSGSCFPKDINSLRAICRELGVHEKLFSAVIARNEEIRPEKDWEKLKGRAVIDDDDGRDKKER